MKFKSKEVNRQTFKDNIANRISKGAIIEGELKSETDLRVDGKIKGIVHCNAKLVLGESGTVEGEVFCKDASLEGHVSGKLEVNGVLFLKKTAQIDGEILYKKIIVEEGANISGTLTMLGGTTKALHDNSKLETSKLIANAQQTA